MLYAMIVKRGRIKIFFNCNSIFEIEQKFKIAQTAFRVPLTDSLLDAGPFIN